MALRPTQRILVPFLLLFGMCSLASAEDGDSFALPADSGRAGAVKPSPAVSTNTESPLPPPIEVQPMEGVFRLCEVGGKRVRYSNLAIAGFQPCGNLAVQKSCDPTGKRFFGPGNSPYSYLDCNRGPRIQISTDRERPAVDTGSAPSGDLATDLSSLEKKRSDLDALLDGSGSDKKPASRGSQSALRDVGLSGGKLPFDLNMVRKVLSSVQAPNQELLRLLDDQ